jgi:type I restriction enzyme S subunit
MSNQAWASEVLGRLAIIEMGQAPSSTYVSDSHTEGSWEFLQGNAEFTDVHPVARLWCSRPAKTSRKGDSLISVRAPVGALNTSNLDYCIGRGLAAIRFTGLDPRFGHYQLALKSRNLHRVAQGSTFDAIGSRELKELAFLVPNPADQRRIADILDTLGDQIRSTERIIAKQVSLRLGIIESVLYEGSRSSSKGSDGWTETTLGRLVREHGGFMQTGPFGSQLHAYDYVYEGIPVVMPQDINNGHVDLDQIAQISELTAQALGRHRMMSGDVVFARRGDLSRCAEITPREVGWLCGTGCLLVRAPADVIRAGWLCLIYGHELGQRHVRANAVGSTMANLNGSILANLPLPLPPIEAQDTAIAMVKAQGTRIELERKELAKLRATRTGLMADLLSGRVRALPEVAS